MSPLLRARLLTVLTAAFGTALFWALGLPLPFLFGPMAACLVAALSGLRMVGFGQASVGARSIVGVAVGAGITPALVEKLPQMAATIAVIPLYIVLIGAIGVPFFRRVCGFDPVTAYYAAMPGGLQDMVAFVQEAGGDVRALSLVHATRVLIVVALAPVLLTGIYGVSLTEPIGEPVTEMDPVELALMAAAALGGWKIGERIGLFGAAIIGPLIVTAVLAMTGLISSRPPAEAILAAQFFIGMGIGVYYVGVTWRELRVDVAAGTAFAVVLALLAAVITAGVTFLAGAPPVEAFLAFAPGGQAEMTVLAIVAGADLGFVVVHHILRVILVIIGAPVAARFLKIRGKDP